MINDSNLVNLKDAYKLWHESRGSFHGAFVELSAEDIKFESIGGGEKAIAFTRLRSGKEELHDYFDGLAADWKMNHYTMDKFVADGDEIVAIGSCGWTNRHTGKSVETKKVDCWTFKDGKAVELIEMFDTAKVIAAAT